MPNNHLYYGDNLDVLRRYVKDETVDLVYLDPPFNSRQDYNVLFAEKDGSQSSSQIHAFEDTWEWNTDSARAYEEMVEAGGRVADTLIAFKKFLFNSDMMAYLAMMAPRLVELRRVLKETGSIYLHCDPTASHYLKILMDAVFGPQFFRNEIVWRRYSRPKGSQFAARKYGWSTDTILFYTKSIDFMFDAIIVRAALSQADIEKMYPKVDEHGRYMSGPMLRSDSMGPRPNLVYEYKGYTPSRAGWRMVREKVEALDAAGDLYWTSSGLPRRKVRPTEGHGAVIDNLWSDIEAIGSQASERLGYPTQKPEALLERIIKASSNEGDLVLDPFCGCGTTVQVAQRLNRRWIGIDITHLAIGLIKTRLSDAFGPEIKSTYDVIGEPTDYAGAAALAAENKFQFQAWALGQCYARVAESSKKGADRGIDGRLYFHDDESGQSKQIIFSVKGGGVSVPQVRDLRGVIEREKAEIGVFLSFEEPTKPMLKEATEAGFYKSSDGSSYPRLQILTIEEILKGKQPEYPLHRRDATFKKAPRSRPDAAKNLSLPLGTVE